MPTTRPPAVAGAFYRGRPAELEAEVRELLGPPLPETSVVGALVPHAGLMYSGVPAGLVWGGLEVPGTVVMLGPNHTGRGRWVAVAATDRWQTPLGGVEIDRSLRERILSSNELFEADDEAHRGEHCLEVQLPFLQLAHPTARIVPIVLGPLDLDAIVALGTALAAVVRASTDPVLIVASSDLNHYEDLRTTLEKDQIAIDRFLALDAEGLFRECRRRGVSMCGLVPAAVVLCAARELGATSTRLVDHRTSADAGGGEARVVGYAAATVF